MQGGVIYDFGMNNGDDVEYYLLKADKVVGVEANPALCKAVEERFAQEIAAGRLVILNVALSTEDSGRSLDFYIHRTNHVLSQLAAPGLENAEEFERVEVLCRRPSEVIRDHGAPRYVKVDLEGMDGAVLREIFRAGIHPPEISAESHSVDVYAALVDAGYKAFSLVDGWSVAEKYRDAFIETSNGRQAFHFKAHSAGPFGADVRSEWQDPETFFYTLASAGLGWKDIHASYFIEPAPAPSFGKRLGRQTLALARQFLRGARAYVTSKDR
ncbi:FkbM family methyltransferase [Sphingomonas daechungensis]|uniref:FkbM family methyltransferase n=1 Tax=Sphingomonas daechungensis TaxID=1176646 RepID=UPI003782E03E